MSRQRYSPEFNLGQARASGNPGVVQWPSTETFRSAEPASSPGQIEDLPSF
jgi:hypothetical protein